jgi:glycosyltransferase involved in cell wall biosynthesis
MMARTLLGPGLHYMRTWDALAAMRVDNYIAISRVVADRIEKFYRRDSDIVYPPVETTRFNISDKVEDYYLMVARLAPYKRLELAVEACNRLQRPLKIVGGGRYRAKLEKMAGPTVEFLGRVGDAELPELFARAKAYIMPGMEDFGIAPVEANAAGRPVIAFAAGGALDTQIDGVTGVLFHEPTTESLIEAMHRLDTIDFDPFTIRAHAQTFDTKCFVAGMQRVIEKAMTDYHDARASRRKSQLAPSLAGVGGEAPWAPQLVPAAHQDKVPVAVNGHYLNGGHLNGNHTNGIHTNGGHSSGMSSNGQHK